MHTQNNLNYNIQVFSEKLIHIGKPYALVGHVRFDKGR